MNFYFVLAFAAALFLQHVTCDIYLHNLRGSNNRNNENRRNRNNANRLFNSQNNDRGGYNVGSLYYYVGSKLRIEWTNQHSCGGPNNHCDIILQYMCEDRLRDGLSTSTIPDNPGKCKNLDCNEDRRYGMHEDFYYFSHCRLRQRNPRLYTADQNVRRTATSTRQNRNGNRYGYECQEERDYYPYWSPTPWKDIAVLTNNVSRCPLYETESQNVKGKYACDVGQAYLYQNVRTRNSRTPIPITKEECESYTIRGQSINATWRFYPAHGIPAPDCAESQPSRDNHLGNGLGGETLSYNWTIPNDVSEHCALRIRYNISTGDYHRDETDSDSNNGNGNPGVDVWTRYGLTEEEGDDRGYVLENDPEIDVFQSNKLKLQLALDTAQYGRTFQDRSHRFAIRQRPEGMDGVIQNINVRGKRGNIVQVYPAVEYDFVPNTAVAQVNSYIHFQWTGSDNNPRNNDGQGRAGTDRSNVVMLKEPVYVEGSPDIYKTFTFGQLGSSYPADLSTAQLGGLSRVDLGDLAILRNHLGGEMDELDDAGTYYDLGPRKVTSSGTYNYMCTRNNNFSNRSQKGKLIVSTAAYAQARMDATGGSLALADPVTGTTTLVKVPPNALDSATSLEVWDVPPEDVEVSTTPPSNNYVSPFVILGPQEKLTESQNQLEIQLQLNGDVSSLHTITIYRSNPETTAWDPLAVVSHENGVVSFNTDRGGHFVVSKKLASGAVAGLAIGLLVVIILLIAIIVILKKNRLILAGYKDKV